MFRRFEVPSGGRDPLNGRLWPDGAHPCQEV